ncbi:DUF429 domain-containing protein [Nocardiopsis sp. Huas11]|uniref:DUF429 domain-containing protein n=1 Tax=Nocardiopsis sp. Huas11 TaxID=2183912 RepID=UPI003511C14B
MRGCGCAAPICVCARWPVAVRCRCPSTSWELPPLAGTVVEVYPAASRTQWGLGPGRSMRELLESAPWLECSKEHRRAYDASEHAFDALIAALTARAAALDLTARPEGEEIALAELEGWIHLPERESLTRLG